MGRRAAVTDDVLAELVRLTADEGHTVSQAAGLLGIGRATAYRAFTDNQLSTPGRQAQTSKPVMFLLQHDKAHSNRMKIITFMTNFVAFYGQPPGLRDIAQHFGMSTSTTSQHLQDLADSGLIEAKADGYRAVLLRGDTFWADVLAVEKATENLSHADPRRQVLAALTIPLRRPRRVVSGTNLDEAVYAAVEYLELSTGLPAQDDDIMSVTGKTRTEVRKACARLSKARRITPFSPGHRSGGPSPLERVLTTLRRPQVLTSMPADAIAPVRRLLAILELG